MSAMDLEVKKPIVLEEFIVTKLGQKRGQSRKKLKQQGNQSMREFISLTGKFISGKKESILPEEP